MTRRGLRARRSAAQLFIAGPLSTRVSLCVCVRARECACRYPADEFVLRAPGEGFHRITGSIADDNL